MTFAFLETPLQVTTATTEVVDQAEIDREIAKLEEDSERDVERQVKEQKVAARRDDVKEDVKEVVREVEGEFTPVWNAAEQEVETVIKDAEGVRRGRQAKRGR